jgi:SdpC family antimicrobial peptide
MKVLTKFQRGIVMLFLLTFSVFMYTSCTTGYAAPAKYKKTLSMYSGQELFEGIFFGTGEVVENLPVTRKIVAEKANVKTEEQRAQLEKVKRALVNQIQLDHPTAFDDFKSKVASKNHWETKTALEELRKIAVASSYTAFVKTQPDFKLSRQEYQGLLKASSAAEAVKMLSTKPKPDQAIAVTFFVALNALLVAEVAIALVGVLALAAPTGPDSFTGLQDDAIVNDIVTNM